MYLILAGSLWNIPLFYVVGDAFAAPLTEIEHQEHELMAHPSFTFLKDSPRNNSKALANIVYIKIRGKCREHNRVNLRAYEN